MPCIPQICLQGSSVTSTGRCLQVTRGSSVPISHTCLRSCFIFYFVQRFLFFFINFKYLLKISISIHILPSILFFSRNIGSILNSSTTQFLSAVLDRTIQKYHSDCKLLILHNCFCSAYFKVIFKVQVHKYTLLESSFYILTHFIL